MVSDGEPVGFVPQALQQEEGVGVAPEHHRVAARRQEDALFRPLHLGLARRGRNPRLGQGHHLHVLHPEVRQRGEGHLQLPLAAIHHHEVRHVHFLQAAPETPPDHLVHHGEVVSARLRRDGADAVAPIVPLVRLPVEERDPGTHRIGPLDHGDVVALDALGIPAQPEPLLQLPQHLLAFPLLVVALAEALAGVVHGHFQQLVLHPAAGPAQGHLPPLPLGQVFLVHGPVLQLHRRQDLVGDEAAALVELGQQRGHHLVVVEAMVLEGIGLVAGELSLPHEYDLDLDEPPFAVQSEDVLVRAPVGHHALLLQGLLHRPDAVAEPGGLLELQGVRPGAHPALQLPQQVGALAFDEEDRLPQVPRVFLRVHRQDARGRTALDLELEARPIPVAEVVVGAASEEEVLLDDVQGVAHGHRGSVGAEVAAAVPDDAPGGQHPGPSAGRDLDAQIALVVLQADVVAGLVLLDQVVLEDQGFLLVAGHQGLDVVRLAHEEHDVGPAVAAPHVGPDPGPQVLGLAHVDHLAGRIAHQIDARPGRKGVELVLELRDLHGWNPGSGPRAGRRRPAYPAPLDR